MPTASRVLVIACAASVRALPGLVERSAFRCHARFEIEETRWASDAEVANHVLSVISQGSGVSPRDLRRTARLFGAMARVPPMVAVIGVPTLIALGLCCYQLATPHLLFGVYDGDDGVYFGAAVRLSNGLFPYRDFVIVHPPGIAVLLLPLGALSHLVGARTGLGLARCLTALVTAGNVVLVGLLVRHRGLFTTFAAGLFLGCFPVAVAADNTLLLEPYLALLCLVGLVLAFEGDRLASLRRLMLAGAAFGLAGSVKIWAIFPTLVMCGYLLVRHRKALWRFVAGVVAGFAVLSGPFLVAAPTAFFRDVVASQWLRGRRGTLTASLGSRLLQMTGVAGFNSTGTFPPDVGLLVAAALVAVIAAYFALLGPRPPLEWLLLISAIGAVAAEFISREFYAYYAYFPAVFIAPLCAVMLGEVIERTRAALSRSTHPRRKAGLWWLPRLAWGGGVLATVLVVPSNALYASSYLQASGLNNPAPVIDSAIPPGACVLSVDAVYALVANRFTSAKEGCPALDDSYGTWIALNDGRPPDAPPYSPALESLWRSWLLHADYLIYRQDNVKIPWTPTLLHWFNRHYALVTAQTYFQIFRNTDTPAVLSPP